MTKYSRRYSEDCYLSLRDKGLSRGQFNLRGQSLRESDTTILTIFPEPQASNAPHFQIPVSSFRR